jgi:hypothetical protein
MLPRIDRFSGMLALLWTVGGYCLLTVGDRIAPQTGLLPAWIIAFAVHQGWQVRHRGEARGEVPPTLLWPHRRVERQGLLAQPLSPVT